jgi:hypothetical protein
MISFERLDINDVDWDKVNDSKGANIFQTLPWINYLKATQKVEPVIAAVKSDGHTQGYFTGFITKKFGMRILGSPFRGWTTYFMGFNLLPGTPYHDVLETFPKFAFDDLKCHYLEIIDPNISCDGSEGLSYRVERLPWFALNLTGGEEDIYANMKSDCRRKVRKAIKDGVVIEEASDIAFADEYFAQFQDVMAKRSLISTYRIDTVRKLIEYLAPTGNILLLRARNSDGLCIATDIFLALNQTGVGWGAASWRQYQYLHPNELLYWHGMKYLQAKGVQKLHLGGESESFKRKFGSQEDQIYRLKKAKNPLLERFLEIITSPKNSNFRNWVLRKL